VSLELGMKKAPNKASMGILDLILVSVNIPGVDGYKIFKKLKKDKSTKDISIVFISVMAQIDDIVKGFTAGPGGYNKTISRKRSSDENRNAAVSSKNKL
jgi:CheY-like chemotaxis protein